MAAVKDPGEILVSLSLPKEQWWCLAFSVQFVSENGLFVTVSRELEQIRRRFQVLGDHNYIREEELSV